MLNKKNNSKKVKNLYHLLFDTLGLFYTRQLRVQKQRSVVKAFFYYSNIENLDQARGGLPEASIAGRPTGIPRV